MRRRGTLLASGLAALAVAVAGCGGGGGGSAADTDDMGTTTGATTTTAGGVLGAQADIDRRQLRQEADRIQAMLRRQLDQLSRASATEDVVAAATSIRSQLLKAATRLDRLEIENPQLQQRRAALKSALRSLAADVTTLKGDVQDGNVQKALTDLGNLSSLTQLRASLQAIQQQGRQEATLQGLRDQAMSIANSLQLGTLQLAGIDDPQAFGDRIGQLTRLLNRQAERLQALQVPTALTDEKEAVLRFLREWEATLEAARDEAESGALDEAKQQLRQGTVDSIRRLLADLRS